MYFTSGTSAIKVTQNVQVSINQKLSLSLALNKLMIYNQSEMHAKFAELQPNYVLFQYASPAQDLQAE